MKLKKNKANYKDLKLNWTEAKTSACGREILDEIMYNPKQFRMGDIFYKIQEKINKTGRPQDEELNKQ